MFTKKKMTLYIEPMLKISTFIQSLYSKHFPDFKKKSCYRYCVSCKIPSNSAKCYNLTWYILSYVIWIVPDICKCGILPVNRPFQHVLYIYSISFMFDHGGHTIHEISRMLLKPILVNPGMMTWCSNLLEQFIDNWGT